MKFISQFTTTLLVALLVPFVLGTIKKNSARKERHDEKSDNFQIEIKGRYF